MPKRWAVIMVPVEGCWCRLYTGAHKYQRTWFQCVSEHDFPIKGRWLGPPQLVEVIPDEPWLCQLVFGMFDSFVWLCFCLALLDGFCARPRCSQAASMNGGRCKRLSSTSVEALGSPSTLGSLSSSWAPLLQSDCPMAQFDEDEFIFVKYLFEGGGTRRRMMRKEE